MSLTAEQRRALQLLASRRRGGSEDLLGLGYGCGRQLLAGLGRCGLAAAEREVVRIRIPPFPGSNPGAPAKSKPLIQQRRSLCSRGAFGAYFETSPLPYFETLC